MKRILILIIGLFGVAQAQFAPTSAKTAFKWGVSIGTRDSTAYAANDSLVVVINRQGRMMYRSTDGYWKLLANAASSDFVPYTGAVTNVNLGNYRLTARSIKTDSIYSNSSAGMYLTTNTGTAVAHWGGGGSVEVDFKGFAGYDANRASSYTARSFTDKNYVDSADGLRLLKSDSATYFDQVVRTFGTQTVGGNKTFSNDIVVNGITAGMGAGNISGNTAFGNQAIRFNTTGSNNSAFGSSALSTNTTGQTNTAIGAISLFSLDGGSFNAALGYNSMGGITTGSNNVAIGSSAGTLTNGGSSLTSANQSVLIGSGVRSSAVGNTNEIVIGFDARGNGSNTVTIGNSSVTDNYFSGNIRGGAFIRSGGTSSQFLKADGSVDGNTYLTTGTAASTYLPLSGGTLTGALNITNANINLSNAYYLAGKLTNGTNITLIGMNGSDKVSLDPNGYGTVLGGALNGTSLSMSGAGAFNGVMSLGNDATYGTNYKTLGLTGNADGSHRVFAGTADDLYIAAATSRGIRFWTNGTSNNAIIITPSGTTSFGYGISGTSLSMSGGGSFGGNVGIGVTPSAGWGSQQKGLQVNTQSSFFGSTYSSTNNQTIVGNNVYVSEDANFRYIATNPAAFFRISNDGSMQWFQAASGSATATVSPTQAMTLTANSELLINTTTTEAGYKLIVNSGHIKVIGGGTAQISIKGNSTAGFDVQNDIVGSYLWNRDATPMYFGTNGTLRLTLDGSTGAAAFSSSVTVGGALSFSPSSSKIVSGITDFAIRNNADNTSMLHFNNSTLAATFTGSVYGIGFRYAYAAKSSNYTLTDNDDYINVTSSCTITLPTAAGRSGKRYVIKCTGSAVATIASTSSQTIDGNAASTYTFGGPNFNIMIVYSDGSNWFLEAWATGI